MKTLPLLLGCGLIFSTTLNAAAAEVTIKEYPDRFVVDYDGSMDPKIPPKPLTEAEILDQEQARKMESINAVRSRTMFESRAERNRMRFEANQQALERRKKEQE